MSWMFVLLGWLIPHSGIALIGTSNASFPSQVIQGASSLWSHFSLKIYSQGQVVAQLATTKYCVWITDMTRTTLTKQKSYRSPLYLNLHSNSGLLWALLYHLENGIKRGHPMQGLCCKVFVTLLFLSGPQFPHL